MTKTIKINVKIIIFVITLLIFILIQIFIHQFLNQLKINVDLEKNIMSNQEEVKSETIITEEKSIWQIEIDKISLSAEISEGTTKEILDKYVGHFEQSQTEEGNIGLAAHNRGYAVNYFEKLRLLQKGDEIKYRHNNFEKTYEVVKNIIIKDTDWQYLENTEENRLTLITCVENEPNYRRCIQAIEKEEEEY